MVSVAMTSYNGLPYIKAQVESVLSNISSGDELIISDDGSTDGTLDYLRSLSDSRIRIFCGPKKGINKNFENAIRHCSGDYIFLCDQDDFWLPHKVEKILGIFSESNCILVEHDAFIVDSEDNVIEQSLFAKRNVQNGVFRNWIKGSFHGCCMAFSKELIPYILPIPDAGYFHDQWIGIVAEHYRKSIFLSEKLIKYYRRGNNNSPDKHLPVNRQIKNRLQLANDLLCQFRRNKQLKGTLQ